MKTIWFFGADGALRSTMHVADDYPTVEADGHTDQPPPTAAIGEAVRRVDGAWQLVPDPRGQPFHDPATGAEVLVSSLDDVPPDGWVSGPAGDSLPRAKAEKWAAVKRARDAAEFGGFTWDGSVFDSDTVAQSRLQGGAQLATLALIGGAPFAVDWTLADNQVRTLTGANMLAVGSALGQHILQTHVIGRELRAAIEACTTVEQVAEISWP